jgi:hypothetical protein
VRDRGERGTGVVLELPKPGEKPKAATGTEPPPPPPLSAPLKKAESMELSASDL